MTFDHVFCYSFSFSSYFLGGNRKGEKITKVEIKSHALLLDRSKMTCKPWIKKITKKYSDYPRIRMQINLLDLLLYVVIIEMINIDR